MSAPDPFSWLTMIFSQLATQLPVIIALLAGLIVVLVRWKQGGRASPWALAGFGAYLAVSLIGPVFYAFMQYRVQEGGYQNVTIIYSVAGIIWSLLRAAGIVFLLVAIFAGRSAAPPPVPPMQRPVGT